MTDSVPIMADDKFIFNKIENFISLLKIENVVELNGMSKKLIDSNLIIFSILGKYIFKTWKLNKLFHFAR